MLGNGNHVKNPNLRGKAMRNHENGSGLFWFVLVSMAGEWPGLYSD